MKVRSALFISVTGGTDDSINGSSFFLAGGCHRVHLFCARYLPFPSRHKETTNTSAVDGSLKAGSYDVMSSSEQQAQTFHSATCQRPFVNANRQTGQSPTKSLTAANNRLLRRIRRLPYK
jgi:hypothetical protein